MLSPPQGAGRAAEVPRLGIRDLQPPWQAAATCHLPKSHPVPGLGARGCALTLGTWLMLSSRGNLRLSMVRWGRRLRGTTAARCPWGRAPAVPHTLPGHIAAWPGTAWHWGGKRMGMWLPREGQGDVPVLNGWPGGHKCSRGCGPKGDRAGTGHPGDVEGCGATGSTQADPPTCSLPNTPGARSNQDVSSTYPLMAPAAPPLPSPPPPLGCEMKVKKGPFWAKSSTELASSTSSVCPACTRASAPTTYLQLHRTEPVAAPAQSRCGVLAQAPCCPSPPLALPISFPSPHPASVCPMGTGGTPWATCRGGCPGRAAAGRWLTEGKKLTRQESNKPAPE